MEHFKKNAFAAVIFLLLVCLTFVSCSQKAPADWSGNTETEAAVPASKGVGRKPQETEPEPTVDPIETRRFICIDPGHGYVDGGCGEGFLGDYVEKDVTMMVARKLQEVLDGMGFKTVLTHDGVTPSRGDYDGNNVFSAKERVPYINGLNPDYLISIHVNAFPDDETVSGVNLYYEQNGNKPNEWSEKITESISNAIMNGKAETSKITIHNNYTLALTRDTICAASLVEIGFCTNPEDAENMLDEEWQYDLVRAIGMGIYNFFSEAEK
ncbi:MAG: N-acetylmuramoyl-L-alanine amidase [Lachnospiraceae bacterium]|nr:N-acetylmuramoyl-L-alanine amidase [Lachnospiraceae bacterium]